MSAPVLKRKPAPHAVLDLKSRRLKAIKIQRVLGLIDEPREQALRLLEVGCGSGGISAYFASGAAGRIEVDAVDLVDQRLVDDGYRFVKVDDARLPFPDASFDIVLSNHVIEHVGNSTEQQRHLRELHRVLKPTGKGYLATPNRWQLVEPHFRLPFLSWLPQQLRSGYVRFARKGDIYDVTPLTPRELEQLFAAADLRASEEGIRTMRLTFEIERVSGLIPRLLIALPDRYLFPVRKLIPTMIYCFGRN